ncbi:MAG: haloacid dehalogenase-like hydrolase [Gemmataceae bacterium]|nr:haloacid dehalogenase-like hydrolase [Gemmataceae bacterium]MDW8266618.1 HAD family hydrolase [Gemmataceae bacterium]
MNVYLFDIDGTLISSGGAGKAALEAALASEFGICHVIDKVQLSGRTDRAILFDLVRHAGLGDAADAWGRLRRAYLRHLPDCLDRSSGRILPGIAEFLASVHGRDDVLLGLLTGNIRDGARIKLGHFGIDHYFTVGGFGDDHLDRDDVAREALREVRRRLSGAICLEQVWVIGDTPLDIRCARAIGARVAAVATGWHTLADLAVHQPDLLLRDFSEFRPLLGD